MASVLDCWKPFGLLESSIRNKILLAVVVGDEEQVAVVTTADKDVLTIGPRNSFGLLGLGIGVESKLIPPINSLPDLRGRNVRGLHVGKNHIVAHVQSSVYQWGFNAADFDTLDIGHIRWTPTILQGSLSGRSVLAVATGSHHTLAITDDGLVHGWGSNKVSQLGQGHTPYVVSPVHISFPVAATSICCGSTSSFILLKNNRVYILGFSGEMKHQTPALLTTVVGLVREIRCSDENFVLQTNDKILVWREVNDATAPVEIVVPNEYGAVISVGSYWGSRYFCFQTNQCVLIYGIWKGIDYCTPFPIDVTSIEILFALDSKMWRNIRLCPVISNEEVSLMNLFDHPGGSDITFQTSTSRIHLHQVILNAKSFKLVHESIDVNGRKVIPNPDPEKYTDDICKSIFHYIYFASIIPASVPHILLLMDLAYYYGMFKMGKKCWNLICSNMSTSNICEIYVVAGRLSKKAIENDLYCFLLTNKDEVYRKTEFLNLSTSQQEKLKLELQNRENLSAGNL